MTSGIRDEKLWKNDFFKRNNSKTKMKCERSSPKFVERKNSSSIDMIVDPVGQTVIPPLFPVFSEWIIFFEENRKKYTTDTPVILRLNTYAQIFMTTGPKIKRKNCEYGPFNIYGPLILILGGVLIMSIRYSRHQACLCLLKMH